MSEIQVRDPGPEPPRWRAQPRLDAVSRLHVRILVTHLAIILAFALPSLLLQAPWYSLLAQLTIACRLAAAGLAMLALFGGHRWRRESLCLWDEVAVLCALALLCRMLARHAAVA